MRRALFGKLFGPFLLVLLASGLCGCNIAEQKRHYRNSLIDYLYPSEQTHQDVTVSPDAAGAVFPAKVALAFAPEQNALLSEKDKLELLKRVKEEFVKYPFITSCELIPSQHLSVGGGFLNLDKIRLMYGTDLVALVSYDQMQHTDEGFKALSYWTIVGMYMVEGEKNDTSTMIDMSLFHIPSRKMLLHAAGTSHVQKGATIINLSEQLRVDSLAGFSQATDNMISNLQSELQSFKADNLAAPR